LCAVLDLFDFVFAENGLRAFKEGSLLAEASLKEFLGEENLKRFINFTLKYLATEVDCPVKRGTFIEFRKGMLNVSPVGRNCSQEERDGFEAWDKESGCRKAMVEALRREFPDLGLTYSIGGQISFDVFPTGWDKTYCLRFLPTDEFETVHFFGDKTFPGGNDYEIFVAERTEGHSVSGPEDTMVQCKALFPESA
jgi:phosphomannomutase